MPSTSDGSNTKSQLVPPSNTLSQTSIEDYMEPPNNSWQMVNKKRKFSESPPKKPQPKTTPSITTKNKYQALATTSTNSEEINTPVRSKDSSNAGRNKNLPHKDNDNSQVHAKDRKHPAPPPIFLQNVTNFKLMAEQITKIIGDTFLAKALANSSVKITVNTPDSYRKLVTELRTRSIAFFTYQLKTDKAFRVVIRNLHPSIDPTDIKAAVEELGHTVRNVFNIIKSKTSEPLPLFFVDLEPSENNKNIYEITTLLNSRIQVEAPRPRHEVVQCMRCQRYGHTRTYCSLPYVCVKCGGDHDSKSCEKPRDSPPTCGLCGEGHTANYRGCKIYQKLRPQPHRRIGPVNNPPNEIPVNPQSHRKLYSYAQATKPQPAATDPAISQPAAAAPSDVNSTFIAQLMRHNERIENLFITLNQSIENMIKQSMRTLELLSKLLTQKLND